MMRERKLAGFGWWKVECFRESLLGEESDLAGEERWSMGLADKEDLKLIQHE